MTFTASDLRDQVVTATDASDGEYDVDAIVEDIVAKHGAVDVDTLDSDEFWVIVGSHATDTSAYTAEIGISSKIALTDKCAVTVVADADVRDGMEATDTPLSIDGDHTREQVIAAAEDVLQANGWKVAGEWEDGDNSYYVTVTKV